MRIVHVVPSYLPAVRYGGPVFAVHGLAGALSAMGHTVSVHTTNVDGDGTLDVETARAVEMDGVRVHYHPVRGALPLTRRIYYSPSLARAVEREASRADIVHAHALFLHPVSSAARAAARYRVPLMLSPRGMLVPSLFAERSPIAKRLWLRFSGRRLIEHASAIHVTSDLEQRDVDAFGLRLPKIVCIGNGLDPPSPPSVERSARRVLFLGRLSWKKGLDELVRAMAKLPDAELHVIGNDDEALTPRLTELAQSLQLGDRVRFRGAVDEAERWNELARASVFVLPSLSENFANSVLEAMAMRCPVVVTPTVGLASVVRETRAGRVSETGPDALARCIQTILDDPQEAARMGDRGRRAVLEQFAWSTIADRMTHAYAELLRASQRQAA